MIDLASSETFWLNVTNAGLGLATLVCFGVVGYGVVKELAMRARQRAFLRSPADPHTAFLPELGLTMADGGEKVEEKKEEKK